jgi:HAMP domain-containing protein
MTGRLLALWSLALLAGCQSVQPAASGEEIQRIKSAATEIALVQKSKGNDGALIVIAACYQKADHGTAAAAQVCAAQDYAISKVSIAFLSQLGEAGKSNYSYKLALEAPGRILKLLGSTGMDDEQQTRFLELLKVHALPAFEKARM